VNVRVKKKLHKEKCAKYRLKTAHFDSESLDLQGFQRGFPKEKSR